MDGYAMMRSLADGEASLVVLDPQYRAVLDKQAYGNEGKRQSARAKLKPMSDDDVCHLVEQAGRVLRPSGHLAIWMDKFSLASAHYHHWLRRAAVFQIVEVFAWNKGRIGMGSRGRGVMEYAVIAQKLPTRAKGVWIDRGMLDGFLEPKELNGHAHAKPRAWTERLIRSITRPGDLVVDPCAGGFMLLDVCRNNGREFVGCDLEG
jgi:site-specific DNA-methyltransferase (adenine-specific)